MTTALGVLAAILVVYGIVIYNRLVGDRNRVATAWSDIDVQLKRRHDLLPKLVEAVRRYAAYEQAVLESVTALRERSRAAQGVAQTGAVESALGAGLQRLFALVEAYPELKADTGFLELQRNISDVERDIQFARRYYNGAVRALNTRVESFPDLLVARTLGFRAADYFELDIARAAVPEGF